MMYHTLLKLQRTNAVRSWLSNPYRVHQRLMMMWPNGQQDARLLWRAFPPDAVLVRSQAEPPLLANMYLSQGDWLLRAQPEVVAYNPECQNGCVYRFSMLCAPSRTCRRADCWCRKKDRRGRKLSRHKQSMFGLHELGRWFGRREMEMGVEALEFEVSDVRRRFVRANTQNGKSDVYASSAWFRGEFVCHDAEKLKAALAAGVGPMKAFGFGLLMLE